MKGKFISFEGPDGCGKTTQIKRLAQYLNDNGHQVIMTREPGGTQISEKIRNILLDPDNKEMSLMTEALLFAASRAQHVAELIRPAVEEGKIVLCDRFMDSSIAYQGYGRKLGDCVRVINEYAVMGMQPDLTFFLDIDPKAGIMRAKGRVALDRLELEDISFHMDVYEGYKKLAEIYSERFVRIDASKGKDDVFNEILDTFNKYTREDGN